MGPRCLFTDRRKQGDGPQAENTFSRTRPAQAPASPRSMPRSSVWARSTRRPCCFLAARRGPGDLGAGEDFLAVGRPAHDQQITSGAKVGKELSGSIGGQASTADEVGLRDTPGPAQPAHCQGKDCRRARRDVRSCRRAFQRVVLLLPALGCRHPQSKWEIDFTLAVEPNPPKVGLARLTLLLEDQAGERARSSGRTLPLPAKPSLPAMTKRSSPFRWPSRNDRGAGGAGNAGGVGRSRYLAGAKRDAGIICSS
jgi:hypothetical protein